MAMLIPHTRLNVTSIYPRINPAYVELACEPAPAKPCRLAQFSGAPRGTGGISGNCRSPPVGFILGAGTIDTRHFWSTNEYRNDILHQPEPAGGYNRTTNNCECIDCSILVFLDCFLSVL